VEDVRSLITNKGETPTSYAAKELSCKRLDVIARERGKIILLEEVINTHAE
jgi:hypothetical protein